MKLNAGMVSSKAARAGLFSKKVKLFRGLLTREVASTGPFFVDLDLTRRCNLTCLGCPYQSEQLSVFRPKDPEVMDFPLPLFKRLCDELKAAGTRSLILQGGGEPLLHPDLFEIISEAKDRGFMVTLLTNGTLIDREVGKSLFKTGLDVLKVSLWASSEEQYERNYPGVSSKYYRRVIDALKTLSELKREANGRSPQFILYHVLNRHNFRSIDDIVRVALENRCDGMNFAPMHNFRGGLGPHLLSKGEEGEVCSELAKLRNRLDALSLKHNIDNALLRYKLGNHVADSLPCYAAWFHVRIRTDGIVQPCGRCGSCVDFGNVRASAFNDIWNGDAIRAFRRKTLTRKGLTSIQDECECAYCYFVGDNLRVHRFFKWFSLFPVHGRRADDR